MKNNKTRLLLFGIVMLLVMNACLFNLGRNDDGTLRVETNLSGELLRTTLLATANLSEDTNVQVELMDGYVQVYSSQLFVQGQMVNDVSFQLYMSAVNGQLQVNISNASYDGNAIPDEDLAEYNQQIADSLQAAAQQNDVATLDSVSISPDGVVMVWRIDPGTN
jgi:hypothetical protein